MRIFEYPFGWILTLILVSKSSGFNGYGPTSFLTRTIRPNMVAAVDESTRVESIQKFSDMIQSKLAEGSKNPQFLATVEEFLAGYTRCAITSGIEAEVYQFNLGYFAKALPEMIANPYQFDLFHKAIRSPIDIYQWGNGFFRPLVEFEHSFLEGEEHLEKIKNILEKGENVFLLANHQTEADPQVISLLMERAGYKDVAEKIISVAGHRVTTDPMAIPFSMGRNLLCIFSKNYIANPPELQKTKQMHNIRTLKKLSEMLASPEGQIVWVAPSGGRDRPDPATGEFVVSPFDPKSIEVFRVMASKSKKVCATHFFPFAMWTNKLMPPPKTVQKDLGERRQAERGPVSICICPEIDGEDMDMLTFADQVQKSVNSAYARLDQLHKQIS